MVWDKNAGMYKFAKSEGSINSFSRSINNLANKHAIEQIV